MYENGYKKDCKVQPMQTLKTCKVSKLCKNQSLWLDTIIFFPPFTYMP